MALPDYNVPIVVEQFQYETSKTYYLDLDRKRIYGHINFQDAMKQAIYIILNTERYAYEIYTHNYGAEILKHIGKDHSFVEASLPNAIKDALLEDSRIISVDNFKFDWKTDEILYLVCDVTTVFDRFSVNYQIQFDNIKQVLRFSQ